MGALKVVLLGDSAVGKSSLLRRFTSDTFDAHVPNTIGAAFVLTQHTLKQRTAKLEIWDTAGQERYRSLTPMYYRNGKVALVCFDMSAAESSFEHARYWLDQLKLLGPQDIVVKVVGTKSDLVEEPQGTTSTSLAPGSVESLGTTRLSNQSALADAERYCLEHDISFFRTSAKANSGIVQIFDDIVDELEPEFFEEPASPQIRLQDQPQAKCC